MRNIFRARVEMTEFADNFRKDKRFLRTNWMCRCGNERESENHIMKECSVYEDIREQYGDLQDDMQLAHFFTKVLERRELVDSVENGEEENGEDENSNMVATATDVTARVGTTPSRADLLVQNI